MRLIFVGGGNMAGALIGGLLQQGWSRDAMRVVEIAPQARAALRERHGVAALEQLPAQLSDDEVVMLAVKPQQLREVAVALRGLLRGNLVISIAAGIRTADLSRWLGGVARMVRAMPNTPALVGAGVCALYAMGGAGQDDRRDAETILGAVGATLWVDQESLLDAVTAVSGSGPAYVFYFMEAVMEAAGELGLSPEQARRLTLDTFAGAARLAQRSDLPPAALRAQVTSKHGTTERALESMERDQVRALIVAAIRQAAARSAELGDELGRDG